MNFSLDGKVNKKGVGEKKPNVYPPATRSKKILALLQGQNCGIVEKGELRNSPEQTEDSSDELLYDSNGDLVIPITPLNFEAPSPTSPEMSPGILHIDSDDSNRDPPYSPSFTEESYDMSSPPATPKMSPRPNAPNLLPSPSKESDDMSSPPASPEISPRPNAPNSLPRSSKIVEPEEIDIEVQPPLHFSAMDSKSVEGNNQVKDGDKKKRERLRDFCFFCEVKVLNFARHIARNHALEPMVAKILSLPKHNRERSQLFTALRKKGNFLISTLHEGIKPMNKGRIQRSPTDYLPCSKCLGLYSKKFLWKHRRVCDQGTKGPCQGSAQDLLCMFNPLLDQNLKDKVFPTMRADNISLIAKTDKLISAFGARYLRSHKENQFINVTSRLMRELARLLIAIKEFHPEIKNLFTCLHPKYFDTVVKAVRHVTKYDVNTDTYSSPTYAMNISTSLKQCCDIALLMLSKHQGNVLGSTDAKDSIENIKVMHQLLVSQWKYEVSITAANDLASKKWNVVTIVPLASDLKIFSNYLDQRAGGAAEQLKKEPANPTSYSDLLETSYCRLLLLNRRRPGELQRLPLHLYNLNSSNESYEEFADAISPAEKILLKKFKRVVIRGKRGRGVPVLFSDELQKHVELMLKSRKHFFSATNNYLFANPACGTPIMGYKVLQKHVGKCHAKNPKALTATRLRKHLATMTQLFNMSPNDMEQLASFMGHTLGVHQKSYRLPDDIYQTAKMSKLLLVMEKGEASEFRGKTLDAIDMNMESDLLEEQTDSEDEGDEITPLENVAIPSTSDANQEEAIESRPAPPKKKIRKVQPWSVEDKQKVAKYFRSQIQRKVAPKRCECQEFQEKFPSLKNRDWLKIKVLVQNMYTKKCKIY